MNTEPVWPALSEPVDALDNFKIAAAMSALTKDGRVPDYAEAQAYAREQSQERGN